jgi:hypothetical protein
MWAKLTTANNDDLEAADTVGTVKNFPGGRIAKQHFDHEFDQYVSV